MNFDQIIDLKNALSIDFFLMLMLLILAGFSCFFNLDILTNCLLALLLSYFIIYSLNLLWIKKLKTQQIYNILIMFTASGLGMSIGCLFDTNQLGISRLYTFLTFCQSINYLSFDWQNLWWKLKLMPWMHLGMLIGGNLSMLIFNWRNKLIYNKYNVINYLISNIGMFFGMTLGHILFMLSPINIGLSTVLLMMMFMFLGMFLGMVLFLFIANSLKQSYLNHKLLLMSGISR